MYKVLIKGQTEKFKVNKECKAGDLLSTALFNTVLNAAAKESEIQAKGTIYNERNQLMTYDKRILWRTIDNECSESK